jgi:uncharacterized protein YbcI
MATQSGEALQALTEGETRDRDVRPEARCISQNGVAHVNGFRKPTDAGTMPTHGRDPTHEQPEGNLSRDLSQAMVKLLKDCNGRGPTHAHAYIHEDLVVVVLRRTMTKAERTLADEGEEALVRRVRRVLQGKFREDANGIVERLTGRRVCAFLSDHNVDEDVVIQAFVLEPESETDVVAKVPAATVKTSPQAMRPPAPVPAVPSRL